MAVEMRQPNPCRPSAQGERGFRCWSATDRGLWVVADGMGGHEAGDVASAKVAEALGDLPTSLASMNWSTVQSLHCSRSTAT